MSELEKMINKEANGELSVMTRLDLFLGQNWSRLSLLRFRRQVSTKDLKEEYDAITKCKRKVFANKDEYRTEFELKFERLLSQVTGVTVLKQFWVGNSCFDFFIPSLSGESGKARMRGLVIEIDGGIHNIEAKMKKDETKGKLLQRLGIGHYSIQNEKVGPKTIREIEKMIKTNRRLDSRSKERVMRSAYIATILASLRTSVK